MWLYGDWEMEPSVKAFLCANANHTQLSVRNAGRGSDVTDPLVARPAAALLSGPFGSRSPGWGSTTATRTTDPSLVMRAVSVFAPVADTL